MSCSIEPLTQHGGSLAMTASDNSLIAARKPVTLAKVVV